MKAFDFCQLYSDLIRILIPESVLVVVALAILAVGLSRHGEQMRTMITRLTLVGILIAAATVIFHPVQKVVLGGMLVVDPLTRIFQLAVLGFSAITVVMSVASPVRRHYAEYLSMILFSTVGMLLLVGTEDLLMVFIALELISICLYVMTAFQKRSVASAEAGLKYFLIGGVSAAFLLFGISFVYGVGGTTSLRTLVHLAQAQACDPLMLLGLVLVFVGFGFKVAAVPFHLWAPDVYEGAPTPTAAFVASGSKVAGVFIFAKVLALGFGGNAGSADWQGFSAGWLPLLAVLAAASIVVGNLAALAQTNVKRLLAYSAIAHGGYMLLGLAAATDVGFAAVFFYVIVYALTTIGAFAVVALVERRKGGCHLHDFNGLCKTSPGLALCLLIFFVSLAGIPPLAGFFGKFYMFSEVLSASVRQNHSSGLLWLVVIAIAMNAVSLYYYLIVLKHAFVAPPLHKDRQKAFAAAPMVGGLAAAVLLLGIFPNVLITPINDAVTAYIKNFTPNP